MSFPWAAVVPPPNNRTAMAPMAFMVLAAAAAACASTHGCPLASVDLQLLYFHKICETTIILY